MAEIIQAENFPPSNIVEASSLTADAAAGQAVIVVENADGYSNNDFVLVGNKGAETGQIMKVQSVSGLSITFTTNLASKHFKREPIYKIRGDSVKFYRAANVNGTIPSDGSFASIATVTLEGDQTGTNYVDADGGNGYWYKYTFLNTVTSLETALSDSPAQRGGSYGHYCTVDDVRREAGFMDNTYLADSTISDRRDDAESEVKGSLSVAGYHLPLETVPPVIRNVSKLLAAGYLLLMDYGEGAEGSNKEGKTKIKLAQDILKKIQTRELVLVDVAVETSLNQSTAIGGWPLDETKDLDEDNAGGDVMFKISEKF